MKKRFAAVIASLLLCLSISGCDAQKINHTPTQPVQTSAIPVGTIPADSTPFTETTTQPVIAEDATVTFLAVGDNLVQKRVYEAAQKYAEDGEEYNFNYCYKNVQDRIAAADLAYINQETIIANDEYEISGANLNFNSPTALGDEVVDLGFDVICMSNNHALDKGTGGLSATLDYWDRKKKEAATPLQVIGAYRDEEDMSSYRISEVNGMKIGWLAYTEHLNGYKLPADSSMRLPQTDDKQLIEAQIKELKTMTDAVIVSAHWGTEDTHVVNENVKNLAQEMIEWGADVIIGTHPHTLQTMEYITRSDGTKGFVFYSLGNFISAQTDNFNMIGGMAEFALQRKDGEITVEQVQLTPLITHYDDGNLSNLRVYPYYMYTDELVADHGVPASPWGTAKNWSWDVIHKIVEDNVPEEFRRLTE